MFEYVLQEIPIDVLCAFRPVPRRRRQRGKQGNPDARNYTPKSLLSLIVTMRYAFAGTCRQRAFPGPPNEAPGRLDAVRLASVQQLIRRGVVAVNALSKGLRSYSIRPCFPMPMR